MASLATRQAARISLQAAYATHIRCSQRLLHLSPVVQKKKSKVIIEDLFGDDDAAEVPGKPDVVTHSSAAVRPNASVASSSTVPAAETPGKRHTKKKLSPEARLERFNQLVEFVTPRLGRKPAVKMPGVRKSTWVHLVGLATTEEQLEKVADMFPGWKDSGNELDPHFSELFVRRCEELSCPLLALKVFGNFSKYSLTLNLPAARHLLHSLHVEHPIDALITASALYDVYKLMPITKDLVSCSMLVSACFKHGSEDSLKVANELLPHLKKMLAKTKPLEVSRDPKVKALDKSKLWLMWTLKKVDKALYAKNGERADWLSVWRSRSGHTPELSRF